MQNNNGGLERSQFINMLVFGAFILAVMLLFQYTNRNDKERQEKALVEEQARAKKAEAKAIAINNGHKTELKNEELTLEISNLGGQVSSVKLNNFSSYNKENQNKNLYIFDNKNSSYGFTFKDKKGRKISTQNLNFTPEVNDNSITMSAQIEDATIQFIYTLQPQYKVDFQVKTQGLSKITTDNKAGFIWDYEVLNVEKGREQEQTHTEFVYSFDNYGEYDYDARGELDETKETLDWIGVKQQFFTTVLEAKHGFNQSTGEQEILNKGEYVKRFNYNAEVNLSTNKEFNEEL